MGKRADFIKFLDGIKEPKVSELGGKGYSLAILTKNGFNVPKGFIILSGAFFKYLKDNDLMEKIENQSSQINEGNFQEKSKEIRDLILKGEIPEDIALEVKSALTKLNVKSVSVRSSAVSEDSLKSSFAGLHDTFLNVKSEPNIVLENIKKCWASLFNERAVIYRIKKKIPHLEGMAVIIQEMIPAEVSGVVFTVHPMDKKSLLIEASYGIGEMVVSGRVDPDDYVVDRESLEMVEMKIGSKKRNDFISLSEGEPAFQQALSTDKIKMVASTSLKVEKVFKHPQDIEWCIWRDKLWLLQSRAITGTQK